MYAWKVVPLCDKQLRDVNPDDVLCDGLFRKCNIYKGGGYGKFSEIYRRRKGISDKEFNNQFVVQLYGCPCKCPYCYVTEDGVWGSYALVSTESMLSAFYSSKLDVFHLMGGAPAIYIRRWIDILRELPKDVPFHSDLLLIEQTYRIDVLQELARYDNQLHAVSIKGCDSAEYKANTNITINWDLLWFNLGSLIDFGVPFYLTFTGMSQSSIEKFLRVLRMKFPTDYDSIIRDSFSIDLVHYKSLD